MVEKSVISWRPKLPYKMFLFFFHDISDGDICQMEGDISNTSSNIIGATKKSNASKNKHHPMVYARDMIVIAYYHI